VKPSAERRLEELVAVVFVAFGGDFRAAMVSVLVQVIRNADPLRMPRRDPPNVRPRPPALNHRW
jgi:hypothetical protein